MFIHSTCFFNHLKLHQYIYKNYTLFLNLGILYQLPLIISQHNKNYVKILIIQNNLPTYLDRNEHTCTGPSIRTPFLHSYYLQIIVLQYSVEQITFLIKFNKYIAYTTHKIVDKFHVSIYKRENAINNEVQPKILLNVFLCL